jgi:hypothetical protein
MCAYTYCCIGAVYTTILRRVCHLCQLTQSVAAEKNTPLRCCTLRLSFQPSSEIPLLCSIDCELHEAAAMMPLCVAGLNQVFEAWSERCIHLVKAQAENNYPVAPWSLQR